MQAVYSSRTTKGCGYYFKADDYHMVFVSDRESEQLQVAPIYIAEEKIRNCDFAIPITDQFTNRYLQRMMTR